MTKNFYERRMIYVFFSDGWSTTKCDEGFKTL